MLWYKTWCETRIRFLLILAFVAAYCLLDIHDFKAQHASISGFGTYSQYVWFYVNNKMRGITSFIYIPILSMGGLLWERGRGTALLSLSLPVTRRRLVTVRLTVGLIQMSVLTLLPTFLIPALSPLAGESYPMWAAFHFAFLWMIYGAAAFAVAFLFSVVLSGEYTALVGSFIANIAIFVLSRYTPFSAATILSGTKTAMTLPELRAFNGLPGPYPWPVLLTVASFAVALFLIAAKIVQQQDF